VRANGKGLAGLANPFPVLPRVPSVETLQDQLQTKFAAAAWKSNHAFAALTAQITKVPTLPTIYTQITTALQNPDAGIEEIAELLSREPAVSAKLLQMVNSPLLGLRGRVTSVRDATSLLGISRLRSLVLATSLFRQFDGSKCPAFSMTRFEAASLQIASWAAAIAKGQSRDKLVADMAFTASLLHNFGVLLLAANLPEAYNLVLKSSQERRISIAWAELETVGATHAEVAGAILASWDIPFPIVDAVGRYPVPSSSDDTEFTPLTAVHCATAVDTFARTGMLAYDRTYTDRLRLTEKVEEWCASLPGETLAA
jgi:HD-like signal output (HDOD) protein